MCTPSDPARGGIFGCLAGYTDAQVDAFCANLLNNDPPSYCAEVPVPCPTCFQCGESGYSCSPRPGKACCGCDWCCDEVTGVACLSQKTYAWENLPVAHTTACIGAYMDTCPQRPPKPVCRYEEFAVGKRPSAHEPPESNWHDGQRGAFELASVAPVRAIDRAPGVEECRTFYAAVGKIVSGLFGGWLCGQYLRTKTGDAGRGLGTKVANQCAVAKRPDGLFTFNCSYRVPCPEKPAVCL